MATKTAARSTRATKASGTRKRTPSAPRVEWVEWDGASATHALDTTNTHNRRLQQSLVDLYARDMLNGNWQPTGDTIKFADTGALLDGQHRLAALARAGEADPKVAIGLLTVYDVPASALDVVDTGRRRDASDALRLDGFKNPTNLAAAARVVMGLERGFIFSTSGWRSSLTNTELIAWIRDNPKFSPWLDTHVSRARATMIPPAPITGAIWTLAQIDEYEAESFLDQLVTLAKLPNNSPILALHRKVITLRDHRSRLETVEYVGMIFDAWNHFRDGEPFRNFRTYGNRKNFPWPH